MLQNVSNCADIKDGYLVIWIIRSVSVVW